MVIGILIALQINNWNENRKEQNVELRILEDVITSYSIHYTKLYDGAVSMDDEGNPTAVGDLEQQMKNCYSDLEKILNHYGCTFDDVVAEHIFTTNMPLMLEKSGYRAEIS